MYNAYGPFPNFPYKALAKNATFCDEEDAHLHYLPDATKKAVVQEIPLITWWIIDIRQVVGNIKIGG